jgi:hypothetical protein
MEVVLFINLSKSVKGENYPEWIVNQWALLYQKFVWFELELE